MTPVRATAFDLGTANLGIAAGEYRNGGPVATGCGYITTAKQDNGRVTLDDARRAVLLYKGIANALDKTKPDIVAYEAYTVREDYVGPKLRACAQALLDLFRWDGPTNAQAGIVAAANSPGFIAELAGILASIADLVKLASTTRGRGAAAKVLVVQGLVIGACEARGVEHVPFLPSDIHRRFGFSEGSNAGGEQRRRSSKSDVADGVRAVLPSMDGVIRSVGISNAHANHVHDAFAHMVLALESKTGLRF